MGDINYIQQMSREHKKRRSNEEEERETPREEMRGELVALLAVAVAHGLLPCASAIGRGQFPDNFLFGTSTSAYQVRSGACFFVPISSPVLLLPPLGMEGRTVRRRPLPGSSINSADRVSDPFRFSQRQRAPNNV